MNWELVSRNASDPRSGSVLHVSAERGLSVLTQTGLYRPFPPDFQPDPSHTLVIDWEWKITEEDQSDWVSMGMRAVPYEESTWGLAVSHSRYTVGWKVVFDPPNTWISHRVVLPGVSGTDRPRRLVGPMLLFQDPYNQGLYLGRLRVEEWLPAEAPERTSGRPHRAPLPTVPFREMAFGSLRKTTAGAIEDLDGDGIPEILAVQRGSYTHLYRSNGHGDYEDITKNSGLDRVFLGTGAVFADLDRDGDQDLVITGEFDTPRFFENRGDLRFQERPLLGDEWLAFWYGCSVGDADRDGMPDLICVSALKGDRDRLLMRNLGGWRLRPEILKAECPTGYEPASFSAGFVDVNSDGWLDLILANECSLRNEHGEFTCDTDAWPSMNHHTAEGFVVSDLDGDGTADIVFLRDRSEGSDQDGARFLVGTGGGHFIDRTAGSGIPPLDSAEVVLAEDFDNDGDRDLYICQRNRPKFMLLNDGHGHFSDSTESSGFSDDGNCDSAVAADLGMDGGIDIVIFRFNELPALQVNRMARGHWLGVVVKGAESGTDAIGAEVRVLDQDSGALISNEWVRRGRGFGSTGPAEIRFGLGARTVVDVEVHFASGVEWRMKGVRADRTVLALESHRFGSLGSRWSQSLFQGTRAFRQFANGRTWPGVGIALLAFGAALGATVSKRLRVFGGAALVLGFVAATMAGSRPAMGLLGSPPLLWLTGALIGGAIIPTARSAGRLATRFSRTQRPVVSLEELVRYTIDFRHSQVEASTILSIRNRVVNLFFESRHEQYLQELREFARRFPAGTGATLRGLLARASAAFPDADIDSDLTAALDLVENVLADLDVRRESAGALREWQATALAAFEDLSDALPEFLGRLDSLCACDVEEAIEELLRSQDDILRERGISVSVQPDMRNHNLRVVIAHEDFLLVFQNLLANAARAMSACSNPRIEIRVRASGKHLQIEVEDNGPGIRRGDEDRIFEWSYTTRSGGKGYGLPRSRELLQHYGGKIELKDKGSGHGAVFIVTLRCPGTN